MASTEPAYPKLDLDEVQKSHASGNGKRDSKSGKSNAAHSIPQYKGEPGPQEGRKCRDLLFLILFVLLWIGMIVIGSMAIRNGNLARLRYGNDTDGNLCGVKNGNGVDLTSKPYQFVFYPWDPYSYRRCVDQCPSEDLQYICRYDQDPPTNSTDLLVVSALLYDQNCTYTYSTTRVLNRCLPNLSSLSQTFQAVLNATNRTATSNNTGAVDSTVYSLQDTTAQVFHDIYDSWWIILVYAAEREMVSIPQGLQLNAGCLVVWLTLFLVNAVCIAFTVFIFSEWQHVHQVNSDASDIGRVPSSATNNERALLAFGIVSAIVAGVVLLLTVALRRRIRLAVAIIRETSHAVRAVPLIIFFPVVKYIFIAALLAWCLVVWCSMATAGSTVAQKVSNGVNEFTQYNFQPNTTIQALAIYYVFGFFWTYDWIVAVSQCTISGAIATYYWTRDKKSMTHNILLRSLMRTLRYHLGSLAFGSLIIAIVQTIRAMLIYLQHYCKKHPQAKFLRYVLACCQCCFHCVESWLKFISKNAYIEIAVYGYSFCEATKMAFELLLRNIVRVKVLDKVGDFLFFLGKLFIALATGLIATAMLRSSSSGVGQFWAIPLLIIIIVSWMISSCFMAVFEMAMNTIFICFCEDSERNDGTTKPYYMTESLKKFVESSS